uniref:GNAT family N-acetyltransferase n=1 Tax=uncultured Streptococcus sp. TaxID=83427 RepID=UPI0028DB7200
MDSTNLDSELFTEFKSRGKQCQLLYISESHSEGLYEIISTERERLAMWLPWVDEIKSIENEKAFIKYAHEKMERNELFMLTICVDQKQVGMIDIHNIDLQKRQAEIGYWISEKYENQGFVKQGLKELIKIIPSKFKIDKLLIYIDVDNVKSKFIPISLDFNLENEISQLEFYNGTYHDFEIYG